MTIGPTWALVTGRMGSTRLPGKTLAGIAGKPALGHIIDRLRRVEDIDGVVVATSSEATDQPIRDYAESVGAEWFAGSLDDVLSRTLGAGRAVGARTLVFVNGDSPLTDPGVVARTLKEFTRTSADYASTLHGGGGYPDGYSVEVFATDALAEIEASDDAARAREHVTTPFYESGRYRVVTLAPDLELPPDLHLSLDTAEDLELLTRIFGELYPADPCFGLNEVIDLLGREPDIERFARAL